MLFIFCLYYQDRMALTEFVLIKAYSKEVLIIGGYNHGGFRTTRKEDSHSSLGRT